MSLVAMQAPMTNGHMNGLSLNGNDDVLVDEATKETVTRFATGLILPPPEIKSVIDRTALFVARSANPLQFEDKIREGQRSDPKFSFLNPADPYHGYYRHRMDRVAAGEEDEAGAAGEGAENEMLMEVEESTAKGGIIAKEPPPSEFIVDLPQLRAVDLDIIKLTALFAARRGRLFLAALSAREGRNYEFDFLRPTHSLFGYFNSLVEQYAKVILLPKDTLQKVKEGAQENARWATLEIAKQHAEWERVKREKEKKKQDDKEAEKLAFAEIDWHDYAIVQTIEFTSADANSELPPPMSVAEMESMTLAQKKMAAMIMENTAEDVEAHRARQAAAEAEAAAAVGGAGIGRDDGAMDQSDEEDEEAQERKRVENEGRERELERARAIQAASMETGGPMKIRTDYVPKLGAKNTKPAMTTCTVCGQQVPVDELQEHMRIELLDPRWKSQRDMLETRKAQASELQRGANVGSSLKSLARARVDIFGTEADEEKRKKEELEQQERRKEREKVVWDGHTASKDKTLDKFQTNVNFEEQIAAIYRAKGLGPTDVAALGPGIGPSVAPAPMPSLPPPPPSLPAPPHQTSSSSGAPDSYSAATVSAGPQPASMYSNQSAPVMLPPLHYQGLDAAQPFGYQPPAPPAGGPPGMHPSRLAALGAGSPMQPPQAGMVRSADQMEGEGVDDGIPPAKRQRVARLPGGQYYPEQDWINLHAYPISLQVQMPNDATKPEWKLDGTIVTVPDIPVTFLVSTLRDHIMRQIGSTVPLSRIMLSFNGKMLTNANSIASYNLEDEDLLTLAVRDVKKKK